MKAVKPKGGGKVADAKVRPRMPKDLIGKAAKLPDGRNLCFAYSNLLAVQLS